MMAIPTPQYFWRLVVWLLVVHSSHAQNKVIPHLTANAIKAGEVSLDIKNAWKYHAGDALQWADPKCDDAAWPSIDPNNLSAEDMPDSLWNGYGWWRLTFTADSSFRKHISRLHFRGWGAAEVYFDGELLYRYGVFSTRAADEKNFVPRFSVDKPIQIAPAATHVLAIRYSNHEAKRNGTILQHNAPALGFDVSFYDEEKGLDSERNYAYAIASLSSISAILLLLLLLNVLLAMKFPKDAANVVISLIILSFLVSTATNYPQVFIQLSGFWNAIFRGFINSAAFGLGLVLIPYTLTLIFELPQYHWTKHLFWIVVVRSFFYFFPVFPIIVWDSAFIVLVFAVITYLMYRAIRSRKPGVHYVTAGAIMTSLFILIDRLYATGLISLSTEGFYVVLLFVFISFPVGLSAYVASQYGTLYNFMEREVAKRTHDLNKSLENLHTAQDQLVQKEKLASLGELTAGIAHEIQNPLNFVNNFSELSVGIAQDLKEELHKTEPDAAYVDELLADLTQNQEKINHHGKRASSIVRGMLEHSRASTGTRERADINALCDEYLRLAYHGMRAKNKDFNSDFKTEFDPDLPKINVIPQDMGRVLLNLINNAFYAVNAATPPPRNQPIVIVSTKNTGNHVVITVKDNGGGIPEAIKSKIFQPFFTTKPTGEGTGLGLSLSYDIVTKGHAGRLEVDSTEGVGTEFRIRLPLN